MTHDHHLGVTFDGGEARRVPRRGYRSTEGIADIDDLMRQLSDLLVYAPFCRIRACRRAERCQGGAGPPCLYEATSLFVTVMSDRMRDIGASGRASADSPPSGRPPRRAAPAEGPRMTRN